MFASVEVVQYRVSPEPCAFKSMDVPSETVSHARSRSSYRGTQPARPASTGTRAAWPLSLMASWRTAHSPSQKMPLPPAPRLQLGELSSEALLTILVYAYYIYIYIYIMQYSIDIYIYVYIHATRQGHAQSVYSSTEPGKGSDSERSASSLRGRRVLASMSFARGGPGAPWQKAVNQAGSDCRSP